jgi:hypothetical protein
MFFQDPSRTTFAPPRNLSNNKGTTQPLHCLLFFFLHFFFLFSLPKINMVWWCLHKQRWDKQPRKKNEKKANKTTQTFVILAHNCQILVILVHNCWPCDHLIIAMVDNHGVIVLVMKKDHIPGLQKLVPIIIVIEIFNYLFICNHIKLIIKWHFLV